MRHKVTRRHILEGRAGNGSKCPIYLCLQEKIGLFKRFSVGYTDVRFILSTDRYHLANQVEIMGDWKRRPVYAIDLPNEVREFIYSFDTNPLPSDYTKLEFEFDLEIPREFLDLRPV